MLELGSIFIRFQSYFTPKKRLAPAANVETQEWLCLVLSGISLILWKGPLERLRLKPKEVVTLEDELHMSLVTAFHWISGDFSLLDSS